MLVHCVTAQWPVSLSFLTCSRQPCLTGFSESAQVKHLQTDFLLLLHPLLKIQAKKEAETYIHIVYKIKSFLLRWKEAAELSL